MDRKLPNVAAHEHPTDGSLIFIMRGRSGYWTADALGIVDDSLSPDKWNEAHNITKAEAEAMYAGSMWGWDTPVSKAEFYEGETGKEFLKKKRLDS